ncbi:AraC family transcriptional regulator [Rhizobium rhizophilum]|uniref:AraC family transcriptional regulator n=1 Tax=Rhizobium rhizophilum TaxID=1850373 RepID=A0ABY2QR96_9HYPH|nr:AraC family transcriptional regulator [Rhizobium rhizophilum]THV12483.1 AraC family transcriptional regulator [Rhizobium rhizophilum]
MEPFKTTIEHLQQSLVDDFKRWAPNEGATVSQVPGLSFHRHLSPTAPHVGIMEASLSLVITGRKRVVLGNNTYDYGSTHFLITSIDLPVTAWVTHASPIEPYLGTLLRIDLSVVRTLTSEIKSKKLGEATPLGIASATVTPDILEALFRLCRLTERPNEIELFAEPIKREIIYRLITSSVGSRLVALASKDGASSGVVRVLNWLRQNFRERRSTDDLADIARMGVSTFHRHFKAITDMSPVQYRKHLQLNEARRLMIVTGLDAASAAYDVGYESPAQFSREYRREFGQPPISSVVSLRRSVQSGD